MKKKKIWGPELGFTPFFSKFASLVSLDIAYDQSLGQCLASSRPETSKKKFGPNWGQNEAFQHFFLTLLKEERSY